MNEKNRQRINEANHKLVQDWQPTDVFRFFADLSAIPRGSGNVSAVADFLEDFAAKRSNLTAKRDATGNVIIYKGAQKSSTDQGVILQAHQDMVCVKTPETDHDFKTDPIEFVYNKKDGCLRAKGTTLGADDGIGVALALAVLHDKDMVHPPIEAFFTVDEETDMKGAKAADANDFRAETKTLINLDAEDIGIAYISSAAGASSTLTLPMRSPLLTTEKKEYRTVRISGLTGGHSGIEINKGRANAYVLLARFLREAVAPRLNFTLHTFEQGEGHGADNAIPDRAQAVVGLDSADEAKTLTELAATWAGIFSNEYWESDGGLELQIVKAEKPADTNPALSPPSLELLLTTMRLLPLGVFRFIQNKKLMEKELAYKDLLVETSCNLGIVVLSEGEAKLTLLARGSTDSVLDDLMTRIKDLAQMAGGTLKITNRTSGWEYPAKSTEIQQLFEAEGLQCMGVHAGLECGCLVDIFKQNKRTLEAISVGPDLKFVHSPQEQLSREMVGVLWGQLQNVLAKLAQKKGKRKPAINTKKSIS